MTEQTKRTLRDSIGVSICIGLAIAPFALTVLTLTANLTTALEALK